MNKIEHKNKNNVNFGLSINSTLLSKWQIAKKLFPSSFVKHAQDCAVSCYDSTLLEKISQTRILSDGQLKPVASKSFCSPNNFAEFLTTKELDTFRYIFEHINGSKNNLLDYNFLIMDEQNVHNFVILTSKKGKSFCDYSRQYDMSQISQKTKETLYKDICSLEKNGIKINPLSLFYNQKTNDFKILEFRNLSLEAFSSPEEKQEYLGYFKDFCLLD